jgi:hypothetical protein
MVQLVATSAVMSAHSSWHGTGCVGHPHPVVSTVWPRS